MRTIWLMVAAMSSISVLLVVLLSTLLARAYNRDLVSVSESDLNFGVVSAFGPNSLTFSVKNLSSDKLALAFQADCSCLRVTPGNADLASGDEQEFTAVFRAPVEDQAPELLSSVHRTLAMSITGLGREPRTKVFSCRANVFRPIAVDPLHLSQTVTLRDESVKIPLKASASVRKLSIGSVSKPFVNASIEELGSANDYRIVASLDTINHVGNEWCDFQLEVLLSDDSQHVVRIPFCLTTVKPFSVLPAVVDLSQGNASLCISPGIDLDACRIVRAGKVGTPLAFQYVSDEQLSIWLDDEVDVVDKSGFFELQIECIINNRSIVVSDQVGWVVY